MTSEFSYACSLTLSPPSGLEPRNAKPVWELPTDFGRCGGNPGGIEKTPPIAVVERASNRDRPIMLHELVKPQRTRGQAKEMKRNSISAQIVHKPTNGGICLHP